jgi:sortase A
MPVTSVLTSVATPKEKREPKQVAFSQDPSVGDVLGSLSIPALKQEFLVIEGTRSSDLKKGVGHYVKSVMPGQKDNCVLSAHRDTFFSKLGELKKGDRMILETAAGSYTYEVKRTRIVGKDDRTVIVPTKHGVLTLTTCYPFDYVGSAPKRYIVSADLVP